MSAPQRGRLRVAPVFDAVDESGRPYFSPDRRRIPDGTERARILGYLNGAPLAVRAQGLEPDPLDPGRGPVVPVGYRTDGTWVWQEASAYYLAARGVAPEDDLLAHIEAAGYTPPDRLPDEVLDDAAAIAVLEPARPRPDPRRRLRYYAGVGPGEPADDPAGLFRRWRQVLPDGTEVGIDQACRRDMRWHPTNAFLADTFVGNDNDFEEISARHAADVLDRWWVEWRTPVT